MGTCMLDELKDVQSLVAYAQASDEPCVVLDGTNECLVVMRPAVFERILFDGDLLNAASREEMRL